MRRDHPRACGEHRPVRDARRAHWGSSPRMGGTPGPGPVGHQPGGIIPAHGGNTLTWLTWMTRSRDHPRACGEHFRRAPTSRARAGSSPRMRGTRNPGPADSSGRGIIPAHAGNTRRTHHGRIVAGDHPRACGEHRTETCPTLCRRGSSPRMRGTLFLTFFAASSLGIIPAHAGNTIRGAIP